MSKATFFRQSGWLMCANILGGALMWGVHFLAKKIPPTEYGVFGTLLVVVMCIPTVPLQMVFAQQTAHALATGRQRPLARMIRMTVLSTVLVWMVAAAAVLCFQDGIIARWQISNPAALWMTLLVVLGALLVPMILGLLQGQQNFLWLGWTLMLHGMGRLGVAVFIVLVLGGQAAGMMTAVFVGMALAVAVGAWQARGLWLGPGEKFEGRALLREVIPLMLGFAACQFLFTADTLFINTYFGAAQTAPYVAAGTLSRALLWLVLPLAAVMFPKLVHATARAEKNDLLGIVLVGTGALAFCGAGFLCLLGPRLVTLVYTPAYVRDTTALLPWYAGAMVPLSLGNVLVNDLLARGRFRIVPWIAGLAAIYGIALTQFHPSPVAVLQTLFVFNLALLGVCALFRHHDKKAASPLAQPCAM